MIPCHLAAQLALRTRDDDTALGTDVVVCEVGQEGLVVAMEGLGAEEFQLLMGSLAAGRLARPKLPPLRVVPAGFLARPGAPLQLTVTLERPAPTASSPGPPTTAPLPPEFAPWLAAARASAASSPRPPAPPPPSVSARAPAAPPSAPAFPAATSSRWVATLAALKSRFLAAPQPPSPPHARAAEAAGAPSAPPGASRPSAPATARPADRRAAHRIDCRLDGDAQLLVGTDAIDGALLPVEIQDASWLGARFLLPASERDAMLRALREARLTPIALQHAGRAWLVVHVGDDRVGFAARIVWFDADARGTLGRHVVAVGVSFLGEDATDPLRARLMQAATAAPAPLSGPTA